MNNEEKANQIAQQSDFTTNARDIDIAFKAAMKMAEWKDKQYQPIDYKCDWCAKPESKVGNLHCILSKYIDLQLCPKCFLKYKKYKKLYKTIYKIKYYLRKPYLFIKFKVETRNHRWEKNLTYKK